MKAFGIDVEIDKDLTADDKMELEGILPKIPLGMQDLQNPDTATTANVRFFGKEGGKREIEVMLNRYFGRMYFKRNTDNFLFFQTAGVYFSEDDSGKRIDYIKLEYLHNKTRKEYSVVIAYPTFRR